MSPRKTRRGAKSVGANETLSETMSKKPEEETPVESQRKKRTRRQPSKASSVESEVDQSPENDKSKRKTVRATPSSKTTRSRKKLPLDATVDESLIVANVSTRRTRRGKENETISEQTMPLDSTTIDDSKPEKSRGTRARKKIVKKTNSKDEDEAAVTNMRFNASAAANVTVLDQGYEDVSSSDSAVPMSIEDNEVQQVSSAIARIKSTATTPGRRRQRNAKLPIEECTPESSPITVSLTPHRTTKTPRKSPMNLGSPKSHADVSLRLSKTPRKLPIIAKSPVPSEKSVTSSTQSTPVKSPILDLLNSSVSKKKHRSLISKLSPKKSSHVVPQRKFSKSPKIVLRSPKAKSPKTKSPRVVASKIKRVTISKRLTKSPGKSKQSPKATTPLASALKKSLSPKKSIKSASPKKSMKSPSPKKSMKSPSPKKSMKSLSPKKSIKSPSPKKSLKSPSPKKSLKSPSPKKSIKSPSPKKSIKSPIRKKSMKSPSPKKSIKSLSPKKPSSPKRSLKTVSPSKLSDSPGNRMTLNLARVDSPTPQFSIKPESQTTPVSSTRSRRNTPNDESVKTTPVKTASAEKRSSQGVISPRRPKSTVKKRGPITDSGTPLRPISPPKGSATKQSAGKSIILSSSSTPVDIVRAKLGSSGQMLSSTPRERIRRSLNLSPDLSATLGIISSPVNGATPAGSSTLINEGRVKRRSFRIEDESNPLISEDESNPLISEDESTKEKSTSQTRLNGTYEVEATIIAEKEDEKPGNGTYELAEPKTPNLRRKAAKRSAEDLDISNEERPVKRTCRVRFASPSPEDEENKAASAVIGTSRLATPGIRSTQKGDSRRVSGSETSVTDKFRRRSNSMSNTSAMKTPIAKRRSNSVTDGVVKSASRKEQNASVNRLSKPRLSITSSTKKQENKTPIARKAPNFAQIHQRKFAKMESLVDAKKRVAKRHIAMTSQIPTILSKAANKTASPKPAVAAKAAVPTAPVNGAYNRYGFKLRKNDAVKIMTQKQQTHTSDKKLTENRNLLKGVRTNRRFDLIMKARNINQ